MTPNFWAPACTHPSPVAALALRPSGACQTYQSPPQPRHGACRLCQQSVKSMIAGSLPIGVERVSGRKIQPLLRDQSLAGQFGPLRQNVRAIPRAVLAWLAAHGFQPDLVCKSHWTAGKVGVRAHGAWDHELFARDLGWSVFQCVAVPLVAQKSEMAVSPDRLANGHKSLIPKRLDCVP